MRYHSKKKSFYNLQTLRGTPRTFGRALRKTSFTISTPIVEEKGIKFDETEEDEAVQNEDENQKDQPKENSQEIIKEELVQQEKNKQSDTEEISEVSQEEIRRKSSEPSEFSRFSHVDAGDLVSSDSGEKVVSALEFQAAALKAAKKKYQSLSAEDIPTWVSNQKSRKKKFLSPRVATILLFSIRPPTLDIADHQLPPRHIESVDKPVIEPYQPQPSANPPMSLPDSRRSSGVPAPEDLPPSYLASDEEFLSTAQFNDLLQLQDWTRTSRKGSDTASNVSFEVQRLHLLLNCISKRRIRSQTSP
ncbi:uncharacterized protein CEXT_655381 [Caerostris extrusa]|uniref:Uncharacterized protein n=1 Tax=Caerostris extrusa TaxID=172846 RepID=A0AAV4U3U0_CAEEX|nr:uncharacterized protein CEXT_655381 [Caerostris extrusa]